MQIKRALLVALCAVWPLCSQPRYTIKDAGGDGANPSEYYHGTGISNAGFIVGDAYGVDGLKGFYRSPLEIVTVMPGVSGVETLLYDVNESGIAVGRLRNFNAATGYQAISYTPEHGVSALGSFTGAAVSISASGSITGWMDTATGPHAFIHRNGATVDLGAVSPSVGVFTSGMAINNRHQIAGTIADSVGKIWAALYTPGEGVTNVGSLGGPQSIATGINATGDVVGQSWMLDGTSIHAFVKRKSEQIRDIGTLGGPVSAAYGINARGQVVGMSYVPFIYGGFASHAFVYTDTSGMVDLNTLIPADSGWVLEDAKGISDNGQIVGTGLYHGNQRPFVLTPQA